MNEIEHNASGLAKVDFHLHSYASNVTEYYAANVFDIPESHSSPIELYHLLKARGMSLVTLTDHNSIDGALEMLDAGLPDVFLSSELTTTFPEDGCRIHVTVTNVTEAQFREADRLRGNIYEMVDYLAGEVEREGSNPTGNRIAYFMTHPLMSTQNQPHGHKGSLSVDHIEKALLLFDCFEVHNGTRSRALNDFTRQVLESLDRAAIHRLADKHGIEPRGATPWHKAHIGGSDDHSGINPGRAWTSFPFAGARPVPNDVIDAIRGRKTTTDGMYGGPVTLAHAIIKLFHQGRQKGVASADAKPKTVSVRGPMRSLLRHVFGSQKKGFLETARFQANRWLVQLGDAAARWRGSNRSFEQVLAAEAYSLLGSADFRSELARQANDDDRAYLILSQIIHRVFVRYFRQVREQESFDLVGTIRDLVALVSSNVFLSMPYICAHAAHSNERLLVRDVRERFGMPREEKILLATDTLFDVNGVSKTIRKMIVEAERRGIDLTVVTCMPEEEHAPRIEDPEIRRWVRAGRVRILPAIVSCGVPRYEGLTMSVPPLLDLLRIAQDGDFTKVHCSTPGPMGLAGLAAGKLLKLGTAATYHTNFPEYVERYTGDKSLTTGAWRCMIAFYDAVDEVVVPSEFTARQLRDRGLQQRQMMILDRWVDTERFSPSKRRADVWQRHGVEHADGLVKFVYVGRLAAEKNLDTLAAAYRKLVQVCPNAHLVVVGDGPYRSELEAMLAGVPATFTGFVTGDALPELMASADAKVFPSTTDTWGNAPLEAQASGLPVVVSDQGGPRELMVDGETGFVVPDSVEALVGAMRALMEAEVRARMSQRARSFVEARRLERPFSAVLDAKGYRRDAGLEEEPPLVLQPFATQPSVPTRRLRDAATS